MTTPDVSIQRFQVGVKAIILKGDTFLVVKHREGGFWDVPGGRIDGSEGVEDAVRREIAEELPAATDVEIGPLLGAVRIPEVQFPDGSALLLLMYRVDAIVPPILSDEHTESRWVTVEEARELGTVVSEAARLLSEQVPR